MLFVGLMKMVLNLTKLTEKCQMTKNIVNFALSKDNMPHGQ